MEKIIQSLINNWTKGVNTYTHNGSTWLIFADSKKWVIELTDNKTLWYNYNFFEQIFEFTSLDVVQNQHLITKWVEDNVINKINNIRFRDARDNKHQFEDTLKNGVKRTMFETIPDSFLIEDTIHNGVKVTSSLQSREYTGDIDEALQKGVKRTIWANYANSDKINEVIEGGIKETKQKNNSFLILDTNGRELILESHLVIRDGVKETSHRRFLKTYDVKGTIQDGTENDYWVLDGCDTPVDEVIDNGIEEIYEVDWEVPNYVIEEVISEGVKNSNPLQYIPKEIIDNVVENGIISTHDDIYHHRGRVDGVIKNGIKETEPQDDWVNTVRIVTEVIDEGIKKPTD